MEMNTRLQVEHPVTEAITGLDLVEQQLRIAQGEALTLDQSDLKINGHAVEARLYAEDPETDFLPSTGRLSRFNLVGSAEARVDSGFSEGDEITPHYDPMLAKIITHGSSRDMAFDTLVQALDQTHVEGVKTNAAFLARLVSDADVQTAELDTDLIARKSAELTRPATATALDYAFAAIMFFSPESSLSLIHI